MANQDFRIATLTTGVGNKKIFQIPYPVEDLTFLSQYERFRFTDLYAGWIAFALITFCHMALHWIEENPSVWAGQRAEETIDAILLIPFNDPCFRVLCKRFGRTA